MFDDDSSHALAAQLTLLIEATGSTDFFEVGNTYFLYPEGAAPVQLKASGAAVMEGQLGAWQPIAAEQAGAGYQVAWKAAGGSNVWIWNVDSGGNYVSNAAFAHGSQWALQSAEAGFGQDLNGDGFVGPITTAIEASGATRLYDVADAYFLYPGGGSPVALKVGGGMVAEGQLGAWQPIGAEQAGGGYQVAWKLADTNNIWLWNVDSAGNYLSNSLFANGSQWALQSAETSFGQDLNGDGVVGTLVTAIEASGATRLYDVADAFFLYPGSGSPVSLKVGGAMVAESQLGPWRPIAAEQAGGGYQVALKVTGGDLYTIWTLDSSGNYLSSGANLTGSNSALQSAEFTFQQDINGDGSIGIPADDFDIDFEFSGGGAYRSYFEAAAARWERVIIGDLPGFTVPGYGFVDDLLISVSISSIDGAGGILGSAAPAWYRNSSLLPIQGNITFDSADVTRMVADGSFASVVLHEMGHVLGIGSMWASEGLSNGHNAYFGSAGLNAYRQLGGTGAFVPLETGGGPGTAGVHWSDSVFGNELMTGFISGAHNPLSILTIGSLQDQGYSVNYAAADPYSIPGRVEVPA